MLHHVSFGVADLRRAAGFYDAVLGALGYARVWTDFDGEPDTQAIGYGIPGGGDKLALKQCTKGVAVPGPGFHLAFSAPSRDAVDRFHEAALRHGGLDNGAAGLRPRYGPTYYAAFVVDPEGNRIEAVINTAA
ncbi:VOC family protein [Pigmentiphaga kullae]|uniref:Catechol 2,3-dioxygenase-like lactoylglutathione lyase family enzyme n=1 Tax=Pigmentiphaga kullae TaxID=151784 RepID=A0A4Q7NL02_9BURK|nr:VOC family protein [Pigmentiphaga kullae]RZS85791.1 catechol 2,3-dioxygenase-like lactoylglutathione lyase family enzyme [Pigmentiphaga kullae]